MVKGLVMGLAKETKGKKMRIGYNTKDGILWVDHKGKPPCLYCGKLVGVASMDGPGVCVPCDLGQDSNGNKRTYKEMMKLSVAAQERLEGWRKGNDN